MVLGLAGRALLGAGKTLLKKGSQYAPKVGNLAKAGGSGLFSLGKKGAKAVADRGRKVASGAKVQGANQNANLRNPWRQFGYSSAEFGKTIGPTLAEGGAGAAKQLGKLWGTIAAKYPNKAEALRQFGIATSKLRLGTKGQATLNATTKLLTETAGSLKNAGTPLLQAGLNKVASTASKGRNLFVNKTGEIVSKTGAKIDALTITGPELQALASVTAYGNKIGAGILNALPKNMRAVYDGALKGGAGLAGYGKTVGGKAVDKIKTALPNKSGIGAYNKRNLPVVVNKETLGRNVSTLKQTPSVSSTLGAGNKTIGQQEAKAAFAGTMDDGFKAGKIPPRGAGGAGGAGGTGGTGGTGGAGGAAGAAGFGAKPGMFDDGILRGLDRAARKGFGYAAAAPFYAAGKALKYPALTGAVGLGGLGAYALKPEPSPAQQMRKGIKSLAGSPENAKSSLQDLGTLYAAGQVGDALGVRNAEGLSSQLMGNYIGGELFGEEGYANIPSRSGLNYVGGNPEGIFQDSAAESIKRRFGNEMMDDEQILKRYSEVLDKVRKEETLDADDINFVMMFEALNKPTNLPSDKFESNAGLLNAMARNDVQNQFGGKFNVIDQNALYPTYSQPNVPINNGMANGGEVRRRVPDVSFSRYAQGGVANLMEGGAANGPGTGTSDSIPAMLSDGEFVMTADAVKNMGSGNRKAGVRKMYDLMNNLEAR